MSVQSPPQAALSPRVFLSYRRQDTLAITGRMYDRLADILGRENVFMDFDNIPFGADFRKHLEISLEQCDILLVVIGSNWLSGGQGSGVNRLLNETDFVRLEIETALRLNIPVIPVLVGSASMPAPAELPAELEAFAYRQAATVDMARDFNIHMSRLIDAVVGIGPRRATPSRLEVVEKAGRSLAQAGSPAQQHVRASRPEPRRPFRTLLATTRPHAWRAFLPWGVVGATLGVVTVFFGLDLGPSWASLSAPGWILSIGILLVDELAGEERLSRRLPRIVAYGVTLAASVNAIVMVGNLRDKIASPEPYHFAAAGVLGAVLLAIPILWTWHAGGLTWTVAPLVALVGGALGSLFGLYSYDGQVPRYPTGFAMWQAGVLMTFAATPLIDRAQRGRASSKPDFNASDASR